MIRRLAKRAIEFYAIRLPYHPGKWRAVEAALSLCGVAEFDRGCVFEVERGGLRWRLDPQCVLQRRLYYCGEFDRHDVRALLAHVPAGGVFFDVGAYFGYYALLAAKRGARAFAFEPSPGNFALLETQIALNSLDQVQAFQLALSHAPGWGRFAVAAPENRGTGHLVGAHDEGEEVLLTTLDAFMTEHGITRLDAMKVDVEGAELQVLAGGRETLQRHRPTLLVEVNGPCLQRFGRSEAELVQMLRELGYELFRVHRSRLVEFHGLVPGENYTNVICRPVKPAQTPSTTSSL